MTSTDAVREGGAALDAWLMTLVARGDEYRKDLVVPFRLGEWLCATNGQILGAIPYDGREAPDAPESAAAMVKPSLAASLGAPFVSDVAGLLEWCGPADETCPTCKGKPIPECTECDGTGQIECFHCGQDMDCDKCGGRETGCRTCYGTGVVPDSQLDRIGTLDGANFNRRLLARLLNLAPRGAVAIARQDGELSPMLLHGDGWRGLLMPLRLYSGHEDAEWRDLRQLEGAPTPSEVGKPLLPPHERE